MLLLLSLNQLSSDIRISKEAWMLKFGELHQNLRNSQRGPCHDFSEFGRSPRYSDVGLQISSLARYSASYRVLKQIVTFTGKKKRYNLLWKYPCSCILLCDTFVCKPYGLQRNSLGISLRLIDRLEYVNELVQRTVG